MARSQTSRNAVASIVLAFALCAALAARQEDVRIHGRVVTESGAPVRGATVVLVLVQTNRSWTVATNDDGFFDALGLPPGQYQLRATKAGFVEARQTEVWPALKAGDTQRRHDIVLRKGGAIIGRVVDATGEPAAGIQVTAFRVQFAPGDRYLDAFAPIKATTDDRGRYRVFGLAPGAYALSAAAPGMAPTFYPSSREHEAQILRLGRGEERSEVDVVLQAVRYARIAGRVEDSKGRPIAAFIQMGKLRHDGAGTVRQIPHQTTPEGLFSIGELEPGEYRLYAINMATALAVRDKGAAAPYDASYESATMSLTVHADLANIVVQTSLGFEIRGRVTIDGSPPPPGDLAIQAGPVLAMYRKGGSLSPVTKRIEPDGSFVLRGAGGRNVIRVASHAQLSRVTLFGQDVTDEGFDVTGPVNGIEIVLTTKRTVVNGTVKDLKGEPVSASVVVFAEDSRQWTMPNTRFAHTLPQTRPEGFRIAGLPAGRYLAVALSDFDEHAWADPDNLAQLRPLATAFTLAEGGSATLNLVRR